MKARLGKGDEEVTAAGYSNAGFTLRVHSKLAGFLLRVLNAECLPLAVCQVAVMERGTGLRILTDEEVDAVVKELEEEKAAAEAAKRGGQAAGSSS